MKFFFFLPPDDFLRFFILPWVRTFRIQISCSTLTVPSTLLTVAVRPSHHVLTTFREWQKGKGKRKRKPTRKREVSPKKTCSMRFSTRTDPVQRICQKKTARCCGGGDLFPLPFFSSVSFVPRSTFFQFIHPFIFAPKSLSIRHPSEAT